MTLEEKADIIAKAFNSAESAIAELVRALKVNGQDFPGVGPLTNASFVARVQGALGQVLNVHLDASIYDPRPRPMDGGGK